MAPRNAEQRTSDVRQKLRDEVNLWMASASSEGDAYLVPLSFYWDGARLLLATPAHSRTARNLRRTGEARLALGPTRDVVILEGPVTFIARDVIDDALATAHAQKAGFTPRQIAEEYVYIQVIPQMIQAWRGPDELVGRFVMRDGRWLAGDGENGDATESIAAIPDAQSA
ncbi:MAG: pyridoxamine 5'-phosphate oxidase family protein [Thermomicrobiales bacterium]